MKRVVVTGIGSVSPLGNSFDLAWAAMKAGRSGISQVTGFETSGLPCRVAGQLRDFDKEEGFSAKEMRRLDRFVLYAVAAAAMALEDAGLMESYESQAASYQSKKKSYSDNLSLVTPHSSLNSAGVIIGSSRGGISTIEKALSRSRTQNPRLKQCRVSPYLMPSTTISMAASYVAQRFGIRGHCLGISNACASGANAVGEAFRAIKSGYSEMIVAGGAEAPICRLCIEGYGASGALSSRTMETPRPFDRDRDGFVLSEGACLLVLEDLEKAKERGANIYGEVVGYGNTSDAFHMTKPHPGGEAEAIRTALKDANLSTDDVDYVNAHGTGTKIGDAAESKAIREVFGKRGSTIPVSAIKSMTGHMLATSGAFEIASTLKSIGEGIIPPTINLDNKDAACDIDVVTEKTEADIDIAVSNSFGFGGVNAVVVLKKQRSA